MGCFSCFVGISPQAVDNNGNFHDNDWPKPDPITDWNWTTMDQQYNPQAVKPKAEDEPSLLSQLGDALTNISQQLPALQPKTKGMMGEEDRRPDDPSRTPDEKAPRPFNPGHTPDYPSADRPQLPTIVDRVKQISRLAKDLFGESDQDLMNELRQNGIKFDESAIVRIGRDANGKVIFLEEGVTKDQAIERGLRGSSGLAHIIEEHGKQFEGKGISEEEIPDFIMEAVKEGKIVDSQRGRPVYEFTYKGKKYRVALTTGSNGYIVGANTKSI